MEVKIQIQIFIKFLPDFSLVAGSLGIVSTILTFFYFELKQKL